LVSKKAESAKFKKQSAN